MDALGTQRIPDPTTAGDFCRRFDADDVLDLMTAINEARREVWKQQPKPSVRLMLIHYRATRDASALPWQKVQLLNL